VSSAAPTVTIAGLAVATERRTPPSGRKTPSADRITPLDKPSTADAKKFAAIAEVAKRP
jgi:hypothetical protein